MQLKIPIDAMAKMKSLFVKQPAVEVITETRISPLKNLMENPQDYRLEAYFEGDALVVKIRPKNTLARYKIDTSRLVKR